MNLCRSGEFVAFILLAVPSGKFRHACAVGDRGTRRRDEGWSYE
jgi:hypothetical protein